LLKREPAEQPPNKMPVGTPALPEVLIWGRNYPS
jgi:hypothetical protein